MAILKGTQTDMVISSKLLQEQIELFVYLPPRHSPLIKYPVLIAQDGRDYFQLGKLAKTADRLMSEETIKEFIIIGVPHRGIEDRNAKYRPDGVKHEAYLRFLAEELVPFINQSFNTLFLGSGMGLIGDSLGGFISLKAALLYPNTFGKLILQSPFVPDEMLEMVKDSRQLQLLSIYHSVGDEEHSFKNPEGITKDFLNPNKELHTFLSSQNMIYQFSLFKGNHLWVNWQKDLVPALTFLYQD